MRPGRLRGPLLTSESTNGGGNSATVIALLDPVGATQINTGLSLNLDIAREQGDFDAHSWRFFLGEH